MAQNLNRYDRQENQRASQKKARLKKFQGRSKEKPTVADVSWSDFEAQDMPDARLGIVASVRGKDLTVMHEGKAEVAILSPELPSALATRLVAGDKVWYKETSDANGEVLEIQARQPRTSVLMRFKGGRKRVFAGAKDEQIVAVNIDLAVIVASKAHPEFRPRFVDRYLVICENSSIAPIVCINKSDMPGEIPPSVEWYRASNIPVIETSTTTLTGIEELKERMYGKVAVLVGSSGVGKSSLANILLGAELETKAISGKTDKGKHTTTASSLYYWAENSYLIDTPGIRSLGVFHVEKSELQFGFPEFAAFTGECQYSDCTHSHEPICGVRKAAEEGRLNRHRYESYLRMLEE